MCNAAADHLYCLFKFCNEMAKALIVYLCEAGSFSLNPNPIFSHFFCKVEAIMTTKEMFAASDGAIKRKLFPKKFLSPDGGS